MRLLSQSFVDLRSWFRTLPWALLGVARIPVDGPAMMRGPAASRFSLEVTVALKAVARQPLAPGAALGYRAAAHFGKLTNALARIRFDES